jgi:hypothetical protein
VTIRRAEFEDIPILEALIPESVRALQSRDYSPEQMAAALGTVFGVDRQLIRDGTYFVVRRLEQAQDALRQRPRAGEGRCLAGPLGGLRPDPRVLCASGLGSTRHRKPADAGFGGSGRSAGVLESGTGCDPDGRTPVSLARVPGRRLVRCAATERGEPAGCADEERGGAIAAPVPSSPNVFRYDVTPDGQRFLVNATRQADAAAPTEAITVVLNWMEGVKK